MSKQRANGAQDDVHVSGNHIEMPGKEKCEMCSCGQMFNKIEASRFLHNFHAREPKKSSEDAMVAFNFVGHGLLQQIRLLHNNLLQILVLLRKDTLLRTPI